MDRMLMTRGTSRMSDSRARMSMEQYRLVLTHEIIDSNGNRHQIEEPIICNYCPTSMDMAMGGRRSAIIVNEMLHKLCSYVLSRVEEGEHCKPN
jgi:hypothetical protein